MKTGKGYALVEGHGEREAVGNLISRLWQDLELPPLVWTRPIRSPNLHQETGVRKGAEIVRAKPDAAALLLLRDEDDDCPRDQGPITAHWLSTLNLPFPAAAVLMYREYETLFLPCVHLMAGNELQDPLGTRRPGLLPDARFDGDPQSIRGVKEWLSKRFAPHRRYKPTLDQLPMTRMIDFPTLREAKLPCFETLERALRFLAENINGRGVYPSPVSRR